MSHTRSTGKDTTEDYYLKLVLQASTPFALLKKLLEHKITALNTFSRVLIYQCNKHCVPWIFNVYQTPIWLTTAYLKFSEIRGGAHARQQLTPAFLDTTRGFSIKPPIAKNIWKSHNLQKSPTCTEPRKRHLCFSLFYFQGWYNLLLLLLTLWVQNSEGHSPFLPCFLINKGT